MEKETHRNMIISCLLHNYLEGQPYHRLEWFDKDLYKLCKNDKKSIIIEKYDEINKKLPYDFLDYLLPSEGFRYFIHDGCHDAEIVKIEKTVEGIEMTINTLGMIGSLNYGSNGLAVIKFISREKKQFDAILNYVENEERVIWNQSDIISCQEGKIKFKLKLIKMGKQPSFEKFSFWLEDIKFLK